MPDSMDKLMSNFFTCWIVFIFYSQVNLCNAKKNVLFLVSDDLRPQLGSYSDKYAPSSVHPPIHTPNLDKIASKSLLLKRAYVQQAICAASRTSFLTGRRPDTTHVYDLVTYWRDVGGNFTTIPQYFKNNGYVSAGMGKIFHPGDASNNDDPMSWSLPYFHAKGTWETMASSWLAVPDDQIPNKPLIDTQLADRAIQTLRQVAPAALSGKKPFFLAVGFQRPHLPFVFPASMLQHYPAGKIRLPNNNFAPVNMPAIAWSNYGEIRQYKDVAALNLTGRINTTVPDQKVKDLRRAYYSAVTYVDSLIGNIVEELDRLGLANNTVISFIGDHGYQLGEHGEWCKHTNFDIATHAPMMIHIPGMTDSGIISDKLTEFVDLFPTLVEATGHPPLPMCPEDSSAITNCHEGQSLIRLIKNPNASWKNASFSQYPRSPLKSKISEVMGYTMKTEHYRYTEWAKFRLRPVYRPDWNILSGVELYDHTKDPEENYNVADDPSYTHIRQDLSRQLHAGWRHANQEGSHSSDSVVMPFLPVVG